MNASDDAKLQLPSLLFILAFLIIIGDRQMACTLPFRLLLLQYALPSCCFFYFPSFSVYSDTFSGSQDITIVMYPKKIISNNLIHKVI